MNIHWEARNSILEVVSKNVIPTSIVLDVGAGIRPQFFFIPTTHIIIEPFLPYIDVLQKNNLGIRRMVYLNGTWDKIMPIFPDKSVDTIFAIDVIEHLEKKDGQLFLREAERIATNQIVIFTPLGMYPQEYHESDPTDRWGMQGGYWQSHRSGWQPSEFSDGWEIFASKDFHTIDQHGSTLTEPFGAFWAIKSFSTQRTPVDERLHISEMSFSEIAKSSYQTFKTRTRIIYRKLFAKTKKKLLKS
jgi:hypothetical protein